VNAILSNLKQKRPHSDTYQDWDEYPVDGLVPQRLVMRRYGIKPVAMYRWVNKRPELGFPRPIKIGYRNYYRKNELVAWELEQARRSAR
jgi:predicted DNA-binding transcriptional regulator AlpA